MKTNKRSSLLLIGLAMTTFVAFVGTTTGTLAWYAYSTRVSMAYMGTSVSTTEQLQIGIHDPDGYITDEIIAENRYSRDTTRNIVWAPAGLGFTANVISAYLSNKGNVTTLVGETSYANCLTPVTTKGRALNSTDDISLIAAPIAGDEENSTVADTRYYSVLPFAFRVVDNNNNFLSDKPIWISDAKAMTTGSARIHESMRIFARDPRVVSRTYLLNPSSESSGYNAVAGMLDLDGDGYYDRSYNRTENKYYEIIYGKYSYTGTPSYTADPIDSDSALVDINDTSASEANTFYAKHQAGTCTTTYSGLTIDRAYYYGYQDARPDVDPDDGSFINGLPITITDETTKIGYSTLTIFLEGWDHSVIDQAIGYQFNLGITFEIDRV